MKQMKKPLSLLLLLALLCLGLVIPVYAAELETEQPEEEITVQYSQIYLAQAGISAPGSGKLNMFASISTQSGKSDSTKLSITLQRFTSGTWSAVNSWSKTGDASTDWSTTYTTSTGYLYRIKVVATAYKGTASESTTVYSSEVTCK